MKEIEVRALATDSVQGISQVLRSLGYVCSARVSQIDYVFDYPDASLFLSGSKIRIRVESGKRPQLTYKSSMAARSDVSIRNETSIALDPAEVEIACELMNRLGFPLLFTLPKRRELFIRDSIRVTLDEWPILGLLVEIEGDETEILDAGVEIAPNLSFANYRLFELLQQTIERTGKEFAELRREAESAWKMNFGRLGLALGVKEVADDGV
jgi:predicted adenylyl cyclase CyaB